jgi:O-antigen ligase
VTEPVARNPALYFVLLSFPVWWALGVGYFIWPLLTFPLLLSLLLRGDIAFPPRFGVWLLFLAAVLLSSNSVDVSSGVFAYFWRLSVYLSGTVLFLYVYNAPRHELPDRAVVFALALLWCELVIGGLLAVAFPGVSFSSPFEAVAPGSLMGDGAVRNMVHPHFAEVMQFLGYPVGRPSIFFPYSNHWGATLGVLTPFALAAFAALARGTRRRLLGGLLALSLIPLIVSLNRGVWISLGVAIVYLGLRLWRRNFRAVGIGAFVLVAVVAVASITQLGTLFQDRLNNQSASTTTRLTVYRDTLEHVKQSPWLGYGTPQASTASGSIPPLGTQGQLSLVGYSHGIPALLLFVGWFAYGFIRSRHVPSGGRLWAHLAILIFLLELPYYSFLPTGFHVAMVAAALAWRSVADPFEPVQTTGSAAQLRPRISRRAPAVSGPHRPRIHRRSTV